MMSSNVVLLHSNNCCVVLEPAICEDLDPHVAIFSLAVVDPGFIEQRGLSLGFKNCLDQTVAI